MMKPKSLLKLTYKEYIWLMQQHLPERQEESLYLLLALTRQLGYPPTLHEVAQAASARDKSTVRSAMQALKELGLVTWTPGKQRTLKVVGINQNDNNQQFEQIPSASA